MSELGKMERVRPITSAWPHEARDFTPWLAGHIDMLSSILGFGVDGLEVIGTEQSVGGFKADIVCRETRPDGRIVVIENQFGTTNHDHLGKLLTYAAGQEARVLILLAEEIREEHEAALDLLNSVSADDFEVFGVEIELWRIGESAPAPRFNVVAKPNDWKRLQKQRTAFAQNAQDLRPTQALQLDYWTAVGARIDEVRPGFSSVSGLPAMWISHGIGRTGFGLNLVMNLRDRYVRAEVYITGRNADQHFRQLQSMRSEIEAETGPLIWDDSPNQDRRIFQRLSECDPAERNDWKRQHAFLIQSAGKLNASFRPRIAVLPRSYNTVEDD